MASFEYKNTQLQEYLLTEEGVQIIDCLCKEDVIPRQCEKKLAKAVALFYDGKSKMDGILRWALSKEINSAKANTNTLFRGNTMMVRIIADHIRFLGMVYLVKTLHAPIHRIMEYNKSLEVDATRAQAKATEISKRFDQLCKFADSLLNAIFESTANCPIEFRLLMNSLYRQVTDTFPAQGSLAVGGFVFLRFFCPAIVSPSAFYITREPPSPDAKRALLLLSKTLIQLANQTEFNDPLLEPLNNYICDKQMYVIDWLVKFATSITPDSEAAKLLGQDQEKVRPSNDAVKSSFKFVWSLIGEYKQNLFSRLESQEIKDKLQELLALGPHPEVTKEELMSSHDRYYQLLKTAALSCKAMNDRFSIAVPDQPEKKNFRKSFRLPKRAKVKEEKVAAPSPQMSASHHDDKMLGIWKENLQTTIEEKQKLEQQNKFLQERVKQVQEQCNALQQELQKEKEVPVIPAVADKKASSSSKKRLVASPSNDNLDALSSINAYMKKQTKEMLKIRRLLEELVTASASQSKSIEDLTSRIEVLESTESTESTIAEV